MGMQQGYVEVELNGEVRLLRFDFNALADVEEYFGKGISAIMSDEKVGFSTIRALYWGGLKWKIKGLTIERAGNMIQKELTENEKTFAQLMEPIAKGLRASGFLSKNKKEENQDEPNDNQEDPEKN